MSELYHERFCRITDMLVFQVLLALLFLTLACLGATALALWPVVCDRIRDESDAALPTSRVPFGVLAKVTVEDSSRGRAFARPNLLRGPCRGRGRSRARRRAGRGTG